MGRRIESSRDWHVGPRPAFLAGAVLWGVAVLGIGGVRAADTGKSSPDQRSQGRELFEREWLPGDSRTHGGDGLGPVYNDTSCVACHSLGGNGGAGPASKNVDIISASPNGQMIQTMDVPQSAGEPSFLGKALGSLIGLDTPDESKTKPPSATTTTTTHSAPQPSARRKLDTGALVKAHPGFRTSRSVVLHRFGTESGYEGWRQSMMGFGNFIAPGMNFESRAMVQAQTAVNMNRQQFVQNNIGQFELVRSQRNPTALFGIGLIDSIPERAIEEAATVKHPGFPEVAGRVSRLKDKRIGRFGWKAQTASLGDFVLTACAVELGLEVPDHHQGGNPQKPEAQAKGLDLSTEECNALRDYVRSFPKPLENKPATDAESKEIAAGRAKFATIGCATCHSPKLGNVEGIYSDLLLHDLGQPLGDVGQYGVFDPSSSEEEINDDEGANANTVAVRSSTVTRTRRGFLGATKRPTTGPASRFEWRTPPLWGFRDSGPYLHDGRADTIDQAVALHAGEAQTITEKFFGLSLRERRQVEAFLKSLTAPEPESSERVASAR